MNTPILKNINQSQKDYLSLILKIENSITNNEFNYTDITMFLDEVKCFWLERIEIIEFEIEELTENNLCFLLSGAIYLDVSGYEHYYFKTFGDYHFLFDPLLKLENFFRVNERVINVKENIDYFKEVYFDTINILKNYINIFYILPIREIAVNDSQEHLKLLNHAFMGILRSSFKIDFNTKEDFCNKFQSFEEIEENMNDVAKKYFIFDNDNSSGLSLRKKIENYSKSQLNLSALINNKSEAEIFYIVIYSWISQILDILLICTYLRLVPYIRFSVTFHYLYLIMHNFSEDRNLRDLIEKTVIFFMFTRLIKEDNLKTLNFFNYINKIKNKNIMSIIIDKIHSEGIDIFNGRNEIIDQIIVNEFTLTFN